VTSDNSSGARYCPIQSSTFTSPYPSVIPPRLEVSGRRRTLCGIANSMPPRVSIRIVSHHPQTLQTLRLAINPSQGIVKPLFFCLIPLPPSWPILPTCFPLKYPCNEINSPNPLSVATSAATFIASFETASARTKNSSWASCCSLVESKRRIAGRVWSA
jgi:hypothetical protein